MRDRKSGLWSAVIEQYVAMKVRRAFRGVWVRGPWPTIEQGLLVYANHTSFWDGFVIHQVAKRAGWDGYALMEEQNLRRYPFHTRLGAIGIARESGRALPTVRYLREVLARPQAAVFIFPEAKLRPGALDVAPFERGLSLIAQLTHARCLPFAMRYAFLEHEHPDVLIELLPTHEALAPEECRQRLAEAHRRLLAVSSTDGFNRLVQGRSSVQERWDSARRLTTKAASAPLNPLQP